MDRRTFLRAGGAAVAIAPALELHNKLAAHGMQSLGSSNEVACSSPDGGKWKKFTDFGKWWEEYGEAVAKEDSKNVQGLDADILSMWAPSLQTKVRMQRARNLRRIKAQRLKHFLREVAHKNFYSMWCG